MASKASKLMQGVNKTGKGLFAGMTPIGEQPSYENHTGLSYGQHEEKSFSAETRKETPVRPAEKKPETPKTVIRQEAPKKTDTVKTEKQETKVRLQIDYECMIEENRRKNLEKMRMKELKEQKRRKEKEQELLEKKEREREKMLEKKRKEEELNKELERKRKEDEIKEKKKYKKKKRKK